MVLILIIVSALMCGLCVGNLIWRKKNQKETNVYAWLGTILFSLVFVVEINAYPSAQPTAEELRWLSFVILLIGISGVTVLLWVWKKKKEVVFPVSFGISLVALVSCFLIAITITPMEIFGTFQTSFFADLSGAGRAEPAVQTSSQNQKNSKPASSSGKLPVNASVESSAPNEVSSKASSYSQRKKVWVTDNGACYHSSSSCSNMKRAYQILLWDALDEGYRPCSRCYG